jgi:hypothetical protein
MLTGTGMEEIAKRIMEAGKGKKISKIPAVWYSSEGPDEWIFIVPCCVIG